MTVVALSTPQGLVSGVEIFRPLIPATVAYAGIDIFFTPSDLVVRMLGGLTRIVEEDDGALIIAPDLLLSLSRFGPPETDDEDEDGAFFDSVLVAKPGYYDGPSR